MYIAQNVYDLEGIFPLNDIYTTQVFNLSANRLLIEKWSISPLSNMVDGKVEKPFGHNWTFFSMKTSALSLDS